MMLGIGMPLMFLVGAVTFAVIWVLERYMVCYICILPPVMGDTIVKNNNLIIRWAAVMYLFVGYWMISNPKIFGNEAVPKETIHDIDEPTDHIMFKSWNLAQAAPLLLIGVVLLVILLLQKYCKKTVKAMGYTFHEKKLRVDEDLPNFWNSLRYSQANWLYRENQYLKEKYGFSFVDDSIMAKIDNTGTSSTTMARLAFY